MFNNTHISLFVKTKTVYQNMAKNKTPTRMGGERKRMF